jgi:hypothetical protein
VLVLNQHGTMSEGEAKPPVTQQVWVYGSEGRYLLANFREDWRHLGVMKLCSIDIRGPDPWYARFDFEKGEKSTNDYRAGQDSYERRPMTVADRSFYAFPVPSFGDFKSLWDRISTCLRNEGFGVLR